MLWSLGFNCCSFHGSLSLCGHLIRILNKYSPFLRNQILAVAPGRWIVPDGLMSWDLPQFKAYLWHAAWMQYEVLHWKCSAPKSQAIIKAMLIYLFMRWRWVIAVGMYILFLSCIEPVLNFIYDYTCVRYAEWKRHWEDFICLAHIHDKWHIM